MAPHQYQQQPPQAAAFATCHADTKHEDGNRVLWIGDLKEDWMEESYLYDCFVPSGVLVGVKLAQEPELPCRSRGYGFVEFKSHAAAERVLRFKNGTRMPKTNQLFRLNWASSSKRDDAPEYAIFVGDLAADVTDSMLLEAFRANYHSIKGAKVVKDRVTGRTKGYGFVRFGDESEQIRAQTEMNGRFCSTRPMRIGPAVGGGSTKSSYEQTSQGAPSEDDPSNTTTTVFVGNLDDANVTYDHLRQVFGQYGQLVDIEIGKGFSFVEFDDRSCAEEAIQTLNGTQLARQNIRLSWGCASKSNKQNKWSGSSGYYASSYQQTSQGDLIEGYPNEPIIFVENLDANVTDDHLREVFGQFGELVHVMIPIGKRCGFVQFDDRGCAEVAMDILDGTQLAGHNIRLSWASNKQVDQNKWSGSSGYYGYTPTASYQQTSQGAPSEDYLSSDPTIFVQNLDANVTDDHLWEVFQQFGKLIHVEIGKGCGFVEFEYRRCAEKALRRLNGTQLAGQNIRLSWGRSPSNKQVDPNKWSSSSGYYGFTPTGYETYGHAPAVAGASQDPNLYYTGYPGYVSFPQPPPAAAVNESQWR